MARETTCPVCNAYIPLESDDKSGDHVFCSYCGARLKLGGDRDDEDDDRRDKEVDAEEDWE